MKLSPPATSVLLDQLYGLKSAAKVDSKAPRTEPTLLSALVCSTNFVKRLDNLLAGNQQQKRGDTLISTLRIYRSECKAFHKLYQRPRKVDKGKGKAAPDDINDGIHIHRMSLVTQVQDLFPDLGSGYIVQLLDFYNDDIETTISNLIEGSLPEHLKKIDQASQLQEQQSIVDIAPRSTPPLSQSPAPPFDRKNVFDNDEFDRLEISPSKLHIGRANAELTADDLLADKSSSTNKAAILAALAAFDSDDDERDDTYDVADVGGTVDTHPAATDGDTSEAREGGGVAIEMKLYELYKSNPAAFARDQTTRRSTHRMALRKETGMTDEAIEGWALMLTRDPKRITGLERNIALSGLRPSQQPELQSTAYRRPLDDDGSGAESSGYDGARGRGHGRGGRGGGRGRGGSGAGSGAPESAIDKRRKDANKGSRANHNRRNQRAKKMARGGL
ncbi:activating signal cointegrator 1 complex subunit 2 [Arthroderma uncinatum]|uniref:activating signal cointegrator 1 complex subunit 2 n=1 Tax=Arthroderma uncinatum TaxID=74035 RepID=UPI00144A6B40|nr:activating signal cointegrator 1 complex subunit 2 [Arthroderma uncinatum]KAF3479950.1 activating signal cointegrator 1 complex subunit 2 [Arthroderma uncinatum]